MVDSHGSCQDKGFFVMAAEATTHIVVAQWRQRNVQDMVMHLQLSCCLAY